MPRRRPAPAAGPSARRRARSALLAAVVSLVAIAVGGVVRIEGRRPDVIDLEYAHRLALLREAQAAHPDRPLLIVAGSSRSVLGFAPEQLPPLTAADGRPVLSFNFSHYGAGPVITRMTTARLFAAGVRPTWVVLEVMPAFMGRENAALVTSIAAVGDVARVGRYYDPGELWWEYARHRTARLPSLARRAVRPPEANQRYAALGGDKLVRADVTPLERAVRVAEQDAHYGRLLRKWTVNAGPDQALRDTIADCRAYGAKVALLLTPEGTEHRALYGPDSRERVARYVFGLGAETGVPVIDARDWLADDEFYDGHHALRAGQVKFTARLGREGLAPLISSSP